MPSITAWTIWDLPLWAWRSYAALHDNYVADQEKQRREASRGGGF